MKEKEIRDFALEYIRSLGYEVTVKPMSKTRYAWANEGEEDNPRYYMVTNFYLNKCRGWIFGLWIQPQASNNGVLEYEINFFADYENNIDKFKPSATFLCETITIKDEEDLKLEMPTQMFWYYVKDLISMIEKQPYIAYYMNVHFLKYPNYNHYFLYFIWDRFLVNTWGIRRHFYNVKRKIKRIFKKY
jgi:hypothetical protein